MRDKLKHPALATKFNKDQDRVDWHDATLWHVRAKRDKAVEGIPDWELLRDHASAIKEHSLSKLDYYLERFEQRALENGATVHWAADALEHNQIILDLICQSNGTRIVKSKSMLTEECSLNEYLEANGIKVTDTDLGEYIVQLRREHPSHIVLPAVHLKRGDVSSTFSKFLNTDPENTQPDYLVSVARQHLRNDFIEADVAITGVNFAVAETGAIVICTNEGNADLGANAARIHIATMGIEKIIPRRRDLGLFLSVLAPSATGQSITSYSSYFRKPAEGRELHIVIVDNGRSRQLGNPDFRNSLKCIRC